jgi:short-subunit dehydrogenase
MINYRKKTVLITGASSGIGRAFAETLSSKGADVILVSRSRSRLDALAADLRARYGTTADVISADLGQGGAPDDIFAETRRLGRDVDVLINNAGFGAHGGFDTLTAGRLEEMISVNVFALARLTHLFLPSMVERGSGIIINVASTAAFQPVPYMAVYGATKAFVLSFSEALWAEYRKRGIRVLALCPGATLTEFFKVAGEGAALGKKRTVDSVVATALKAVERGRCSVVDGTLNRLATLSVRLSPRGFVAKSAERLMSPR